MQSAGAVYALCTVVSGTHGNMTDGNKFNTAALSLKSLEERRSKLSLSDQDAHVNPETRDAIKSIAAQIVEAKAGNRKVILFMGAHLIKLGLTRYITSLILGGYIDHVATNGACAIHDFELNTHGSTSEDVKTYIAEGQFGLWTGTSGLNDAIADRPEGCDSAGAAIGHALYHKYGADPATSIFAACHHKGVPITVHILIGGDINHSHPNFDAASWGICSYNDFLIFTESLRGINHGGVFLNVGSAVHGPEVFLKALSMVRNVSTCEQFSTGVFDFADLPLNWRDFEPHPSTPLYYFRPWKTLLLRTNKDGQSEYACGDFSITIPLLWGAIDGVNDGYSE
jgi:hypothetical protein